MKKLLTILLIFTFSICQAKDIKTLKSEIKENNKTIELYQKVIKDLKENSKRTKVYKKLIHQLKKEKRIIKNKNK